MHIRLIYILIFWISFSLSQAQNQANVWYFGEYAGLDFNSGQPFVLDGFFHAWRSSASISDSTGTFLFATNGQQIWNRNKEVMLNGEGLKGHDHNSQGSLIVQKPGSDHLYYVFTVGFYMNPPSDYGLYYSVVDMELDNGLGGVTSEKNVLLVDAWDAVDKIVAVRQEYSENIWVICRKFTEDGYAAFLLTPNGVYANSVYSPSIDRPTILQLGSIKISHNKKYLVSGYSTNTVGAGDKPDFEICTFDANTGEIELLYTIRNIDLDGCDNYQPTGAEFSSDSKFLYLTFLSQCDRVNPEIDNPIPLFQYDIRYIEDSALFYANRILIKEGPGLGLQLARDGKIYCSSDGYNPYEYVSVIHKPWVRGTGCNYEADAIDLVQGRVGSFFPNTLTDHLFRFEWEGRCSSEPFVFQHNFIPEPTKIRWSFSDPASGVDSISFDLNPVHYFTKGGDYEVKAVVEYPYGRVERTSRVVTVIDSPHPNLGPDTLMCEQGDIVLNAGEEEGIYVWSDGTFGENANEILVSDTGWYWVQVTNDENCSEIDSIYVGLYPKSEIIEDNLIIIPSTCGGSTGEITGLLINGTEPLTYAWYDADSTLIGTNLDIEDLPVGNFYLYILDGNGCTTISDAFTIYDSGDIEVTSVQQVNTHCGQSLGSITISVNVGNTGDLFYSIDNGNNWQTGNPVFTGLSPGNYFIRVKDESGCVVV